MCVHGRRQTQSALQTKLPRRAAQEVSAAPHVRDALSGVVHGDGELVGVQAVAPSNDEIADRLRKIVLLRALQLVVEDERACGREQANGGRTIRRADAVATPTGVVRLV